MRLSEDVIRYLTIKQEGPLPTPKSSNIGSNQSEKKENENIDLTNTSETEPDATNNAKTNSEVDKTPEVNETIKS